MPAQWKRGHTYQGSIIAASAVPAGTLPGAMPGVPPPLLTDSPSCNRAPLLSQIYLVAANELPTYTGLAPQCASYEQAAATAAGKGGAACTGQPQLACAQPRVREDKQVWQTGTPVAWQAVPTNSSGNSSSNNGTSLAWQQPASGAWGRPAKLALSLESGAPPSFVWGPLLPGSMQTADSFGITFSLDRAALFVYGGLQLACIACDVFSAALSTAQVSDAVLEQACCCCCYCCAAVR